MLRSFHNLWEVHYLSLFKIKIKWSFHAQLFTIKSYGQGLKDVRLNKQQHLRLYKKKTQTNKVNSKDANWPHNLWKKKKVNRKINFPMTPYFERELSCKKGKGKKSENKHNKNMLFQCNHLKKEERKWPEEIREKEEAATY